MCILVYIPDIVWMLKGTNLIIDSTLITLTLNSVRPKQREELVCSMITISENAAPETHEEMNLWHNCKKQECQDFILFF